jgi:hypothetical protein
MNPGRKDVIHMLYLGVALSKTEGKEQECLNTLKDAVDDIKFTVFPSLLL